MGIALPIVGALGSIASSLIPALFSKRGDQTKGSLFTKPEKFREFEKFTPEQTSLLGNLRSALTGQGQIPQGGLLGQLFSPEGFEAYAAPARREFFESTVPGLAERFSSLGAGAQGSSAFQQQLAEAGKRLSTKLGELRSQQQQSLLGPLLQQVMQPTKHQIFQPSEPTGLAKALGSIGGTGLQAFLNMLGIQLANRETGTSNKKQEMFPVTQEDLYNQALKQEGIPYTPFRILQ